MKYFLTSLLLIISFLQVSSQSGIIFSGGSFSSANNSLSFSAGQIDYSNFSSSEVQLSQGIQQPFELYFNQIFDESDKHNYDISVYPNPSKDFFQINFDKNDFTNGFSFILFDSKMRILKQGKVIDPNNEINISELSSQLYFLNIYFENKEVTTFKIVKL
jgi:hypothetical protein